MYNLLNKLILVFVVAFLLIPASLAYGVSYPFPSNIELLRGESARFKIQIQSIADPKTVSCTYSVDNTFPLGLEFDAENLIVVAGTRDYVYGTVTAPSNMNVGTYEANFCIRCENVEKAAGTVIQQEVCDLPLIVDVVATRTKENKFVPEKPQPPRISLSVIIMLLIIIVLAIIIGVTLYKRKPISAKMPMQITKKKKR